MVDNLTIRKRVGPLVHTIQSKRFEAFLLQAPAHFHPFISISLSKPALSASITDRDPAASVIASDSWIGTCGAAMMDVGPVAKRGRDSAPDTLIPAVACCSSEHLLPADQMVASKTAII